MKLIYTHINPTMVGLVQSMMENAGVEVMMRNEFSGSGFPPYHQNQELWLVNDSDLEAAENILAEMEEEQDQDS